MVIIWLSFVIWRFRFCVLPIHLLHVPIITFYFRICWCLLCWSGNVFVFSYHTVCSNDVQCHTNGCKSNGCNPTTVSGLSPQVKAATSSYSRHANSSDEHLQKVHIDGSQLAKGSDQRRSQNVQTNGCKRFNATAAKGSDQRRSACKRFRPTASNGSDQRLQSGAKFQSGGDGAGGRSRALASGDVSKLRLIHLHLQVLANCLQRRRLRFETLRRLLA